MRATQVRELIDHLGHLLPAQKPLEAFVHHNTLHAFEHLPFNEGVEQAAETFGAQPYMTEEAFREAWASGRILATDLDKVLLDEVPDDRVTLGDQRLDLRDIVRVWMRHLAVGDGGATLRWRLEETNELESWPRNLPRAAFERLSALGDPRSIQQALWRQVSRSVARESAACAPSRPRDVVLWATGHDTDALVNPTLIRWCAAFLDPGHSYWPMTDSAGGFYKAMLAHLSRGGSPLRRWMGSLAGRAQLLSSAQTSPEGCIVETLDRLGWPDSTVEDLLRETLLTLPGWPGMFVQLAARPDLAPAPPPPTDLVDFVAVRLLLDEAAARSLGGRPTGAFPRPTRHQEPDAERRWIVFNAVRLLGIRPAELTPDVLDTVDRLLNTYDHVRRRWLWQLAYERRYRVEILDGVLAHWAKTCTDQAPRAAVQVVTCIDDREESLRRHLEEIGPQYQTFGVAGFYGVAAYFRSLNSPHQRPLCPAPVVPTHLLKEVAVDEQGWGRTRVARRRIGRVVEALSIGSDTLFRGGLIALWGWGSIVPLATRILAPRLHGKLATPRQDARTQLRLEGDGLERDHGLQVGFTVDEMTTIVQKTLEDMGLTNVFAPLVVVLGHGSRSLNNPHEAAHDCGACGGGRGGPNARAFAQMANRADIRRAVAQAGISIPDSTWFIGGYHNTCDDNITLYDLEAVPEEFSALLDQTRRDFDTARALDAHERVRRFESAALDIEPAAALEHAENRAEDLAQPRPEYGHCTNALCFVGRREWSRGLYLDRRVFLTSHDPQIDPTSELLERLLASVGPVGAGINLEYYFSFVDRDRYGCNTKLPHNITALLGVMDGHSSDLRTGLPWQMVEIHEPVRLLNVIEARPETLLAILDRQPALKQLIVNRWILVAAFDPSTHEMWFFEKSGFQLYKPESTTIPTAITSVDYYRGKREHLPPASIERGRARRAGEAAA